MISTAKLQKRKQIYDFFVKTAHEDNLKNQKKDFKELLDVEDKGRRILVVMPRSVGDVFMATSLLQGLKETYPEYNIYFATEPNNFELLDGNPYVHKLLPYHTAMDNLLVMEGAGEHDGYFDICFLPTIGTQKILNYTHNGKTRHQFNLNNFKI